MGALYDLDKGIAEEQSLQLCLGSSKVAGVLSECR